MPLNVRLRFRDEYEVQCQECADWWPLTAEFWAPNTSYRRCRACLKDSRRARERMAYHTNPAVRAAKRIRSAASRARDRQRKARERRDPERRPLILERSREAQARFYADGGRERARESYARKVGRPLRPGIGRPRQEVVA